MNKITANYHDKSNITRFRKKKNLENYFETLNLFVKPGERENITTII